MFFYPEKGAKIGGLDVAAYSRERRVLDHETVGDIEWADIPDEQRSSGQCGQTGSLTSPVTLDVDRVPYYVGPRFLDDETARAFSPSNPGFDRIVALRYGPEEPTRDTETPWQPGEPTATAYQQVEVQRLPWPRPDEQALSETATLTAIEFRSASACSRVRDPPRIRQFGSSDGSDVRVEWSRPIPANSCHRPFLTDASYEAGVLTIQIGLQRISHVVCRDCDRLPYQFRAAYRAEEPPDLGRVVIEHRSRTGELVERTVVSPD